MIPARAPSHRLATLIANGHDRQWSANEVDWRESVFVPSWFPRKTYIAAISQLYHGELATAEACRRLLATPLGIDTEIRACLEIQIRDEIRHAEVYRAYLARLGDIVPSEPVVAAMLERGYGWREPILGTVLSYHVMLEGEALNIQQGLATWLPCPLFRAVNARIVVDEARHVGFGKTYLPARIADIPIEERGDLFLWIKELWHDCARPVMEKFHVPGVMSPRIRRRWLKSRWQRQVRDLASIGLIEANNAAPSARL